MLFSDMLLKLKKWDAAYAKGKPLVSDDTYDALRDKAKKLKPKDPYFKLLSTRGAPGEKVKLPTPMMSLDKIRPSDLSKWVNYKAEYLVSPKLDGLSGKVQYKKGKQAAIYTRGDGEIGRNVTHTAKYVNGVLPCLPENIDAEFNGEFIIHRSIFENLKNILKKDVAYKAPRNFVVGMLNTKEAVPTLLSQMTFVVYSVDCKNKKFKHKLEQLQFAANYGFVTVHNLGRCSESTYNDHQMGKLPKYPENHIGYSNIGKYHFNKDELTEKLMSFYLTHWRKIIDIDQDGLVLEIADMVLRKALGGDGTPNYAIAIKPEIADHESQNCELDHVEWNISPRGLYKTTLVLKKPAVFKGVEITRMSGFNAKAIKDAGGLGKGSIIKVIRSGDVIPRWVETIKNVPAKLPEKCIHCGTALKWTKTNTDLLCDNTNCVGFQSERVIGFFSKFKIDKLSTGTLTKLIKQGYNTVPKIMRISEEVLARIDGLGPKSSKTIITNMLKKLEKVSLAEVMDASAMFTDTSSGLGKRRAKMIINRVGEKWLLEGQIDDKLYKILHTDIEGIGPILADQLYDNLAAFREFYRELPIGQIEKQVRGKVQGKYGGKIAVWSGYRSKEEEDIWVKNGGQVGGGVTKKTSVLFTSTPGSTKSKKAIDYGIKIVGKNDAETYLKD